ncbi:hypothetical protein BJ138DRAFT_1142808 [Hygrophoropsis aurantiaca]|uniref:Uncharacterized protein n=1 Tax=Hygrophoropsis aurantiaca TaxID=72124 RepID=A0ACB8AR93_9AGAM|nr:hypothetical protein BJ138DRAFT_1142808 [Hygrophoropsis aurantiaca]
MQTYSHTSEICSQPSGSSDCSSSRSPTPPLSPEASAKQAKIFDTINRKLGAFVIDSNSTTQSYTINGVDANAIHVPNGELFAVCPKLVEPSFRMDWMNDMLVVKRCPVWHTLSSSFFLALGQLGQKGIPFARYNGSAIQIGGAAAIRLSDGYKNPTCSFYDVNPRRELRLNDLPTVVIEVGYQQTPAELSFNAGRIICASMGTIQLVIAVQLEFSKGSSEKGNTELEKLVISNWEPIQTENPTEWDGPLNEVFRDDDSVEVDERGLTRPPATRYKLVTKRSRGYTQFTARQTTVKEIIAPNSSHESEECIRITYGQLYRDSQEDDFDKPAMSIPYSLLWNVIKSTTSSD